MTSKHVGIVKIGTLEIAVQSNIANGEYHARASCGARAHEYSGPTGGAGVVEIAETVAQNFATRLRKPSVSPAKARRILHDTAGGKPFKSTGRSITAAQRRFFGAMTKPRASAKRPNHWALPLAVGLPAGAAVGYAAHDRVQAMVPRRANGAQKKTPITIYTPRGASKCSTCGRAPFNPYTRVVGGKIAEMCVDPIHGPHLVPISSSASFHHAFWKKHRAVSPSGKRWNPLKLSQKVASAGSLEALKSSIAQFYYSSPDRIAFTDAGSHWQVQNGDKKVSPVVVRQGKRFVFGVAEVPRQANSHARPGRARAAGEVVDVHGRTHVTKPQGHGAGRDFYVSVIDGGRTGFLLGPYKTHGEALAHVDLGRRMAESVNDRAIWYTYGTASAPHGQNVKTVFSLAEARTFETKHGLSRPASGGRANPREFRAWSGGSRPRALGEISPAEKALVLRLYKEQIKTFTDFWKTAPDEATKRIFLNRARGDAHATHRDNPVSREKMQALHDAARAQKLAVHTRSPGDGLTRYGFFRAPEAPGQTYFGPASTVHVALGWRDAYDYATGMGKHRTNPARLPRDPKLSTDLNLYNTLSEEQAGFPTAKRVLASLSDKDLQREQASLLRASFDRMFGHNAKKMLALVEAEMKLRGLRSGADEFFGRSNPRGSGYTSLHKVRLQGDYDPSGYYWGGHSPGQILYVETTGDGYEVYVRAADRVDAMNKLARGEGRLKGGRTLEWARSENPRAPRPPLVPDRTPHGGQILHGDHVGHGWLQFQQESDRARFGADHEAIKRAAAGATKQQLVDFLLALGKIPFKQKTYLVTQVAGAQMDLWWPIVKRVPWAKNPLETSEAKRLLKRAARDVRHATTAAPGTFAKPLYYGRGEGLALAVALTARDQHVRKGAEGIRSAAVQRGILSTGPGSGYASALDHPPSGTGKTLAKRNPEPGVGPCKRCKGACKVKLGKNVVKCPTCGGKGSR